MFEIEDKIGNPNTDIFNITLLEKEQKSFKFAYARTKPKLSIEQNIDPFLLYIYIQYYTYLQYTTFFRP